MHHETTSSAGRAVTSRDRGADPGPHSAASTTVPSDGPGLDPFDGLLPATEIYGRARSGAKEDGRGSREHGA